MSFFEELKNKNERVANLMEKAMMRSDTVGLRYSVPKYRECTSNEIEAIYQVVDSFRNVIDYDQGKGTCILVHINVFNMLREKGVSCELVFGNVIINGKPYWDIQPEDLIDQINEGVGTGAQNVHCWILLENHNLLDCTIAREVYSNGIAGELISTGDWSDGQGNSFQHVPMLVGSEFINRTNPIDEVSMS